MLSKNATLLLLASALVPAQDHPETQALRTGQTKVNPKDGMTYVWIEPGTFSMGCVPGSDPDRNNVCLFMEPSTPAHQVTITKGFWIGQTLVTQEAYEMVMGSNPSRYKGSKRPVETVNWNESESYCQAVGVRLPTEAGGEIGRGHV